MKKHFEESGKFKGGSICLKCLKSQLKNKLKDIHRENRLSNKTKATTKSMNMHIWETGTLNQLFIRGSYNETNFSRKLGIENLSFLQ